MCQSKTAGLSGHLSSEFGRASRVVYQQRQLTAENEGADAMILTAALQTIWDCRWSRPGYRVLGVQDHLQPEKLWVCIRRGERQGVTEEDCEHCPHWEAL